MEFLEQGHDLRAIHGVLFLREHRPPERLGEDPVLERVVEHRHVLVVVPLVERVAVGEQRLHVRRRRVWGLELVEREYHGLK